MTMSEILRKYIFAEDILEYFINWSEGHDLMTIDFQKKKKPLTGEHPIEACKDHDLILCETSRWLSLKNARDAAQWRIKL